MNVCQAIIFDHGLHHLDQIVIILLACQQHQEPHFIKDWFCIILDRTCNFRLFIGICWYCETILEYISEDQTFWKALNSKVTPFLSKIGGLPLGAELLEVLPIIQNAVYIIPLWSMFCHQCHMHICVLNHLHANLKVMLFTLISSKYKRTTFAKDTSISSLGDFDHLSHNDERATPDPSLRTQDGSGMATSNPEDILILLPLFIGLKACLLHHAKSLAVKESKLWYAQANDAIHQICLALGFKSALFHTHVQPANMQQTKTQAWNAVHNVDSTLSEHAQYIAWHMMHTLSSVTRPVSSQQCHCSKQKICT